MQKIIVTGPGPNVGKTIVSAILTTLMEGDYWKPIQCGPELDTHIVNQLLDPAKHHIYPSAYSLKAAVSPHHAARIENITIRSARIKLPVTDRPLIIEMAGGPLTPLRTSFTNLELFKGWKGQWIVVSRHYLGSINHTLLTIEALKARKMPLLGIIFNGDPHPDTETAILSISRISFLGRLFPEKTININRIQNYACQWKKEKIYQILQNG